MKLYLVNALEMTYVRTYLAIFYQHALEHILTNYYYSLKLRFLVNKYSDYKFNIA